MDAVLLSRIKFAVTAGFHFIFPPLTIGMSWVIVWLLGRYRKTGDESFARAARFWLKIFAITFAVGLATGITLEFQFGTNWAKYSKFVGDIFGPPLAAEAIFAFFLESTFMGVLLFGWKRVSPRTLWISALMVAIGATISAFWIIVANSWMQTPAGYEIIDGKAVLTDFAAAVFNPSTMPRFLHTVTGSLISGGMMVMGISAWYLLKKRHVDFARTSMIASLVMVFAASGAQMGLGHWHAVQVAHTQPEKLAAFEGLYETQSRAPALLFGVPNEEAERMDYAIRIPGVLSLMAFGDMDAEVQGLKDFPKADRPPMAMTFYPFHLMVMLGGYFVFLSSFGLFQIWRKKLGDGRLFLYLALWSIPLPIIANELGWIAAEVGRQPWIVYHVLRTAQAISPVSVVSASQVLFEIILLSVIYLAIFAAWLYLVLRQVARGPTEATSKEAAA